MLVVLGIRSHFVTRLPEWILAVGLVFEGLKVATHDTLVGGGSTRTYAVLADIVSGFTAGTAGVAIGSAWLLALSLNGTFVQFRRVSPWLRSGCALVAAFYWMVFALAMYFGNIDSVGPETHGTLAIMAAAYAILVAREVSAVEGEADRCRLRRRR